MLFILVVTFTIIHDKRDPVKALGWITVINLLPILGVVMYIAFGRNHRKEKMFSRKELRDLQQIEVFSLNQLDLIKDSPMMQIREIADNKDIITLLLTNNKALLTINNRVKILNNGSQTFSAITNVLKNAEKSIHLEYYIICDDEIGSQVADILIAKAKEGVEVRLIYDDVGSWGLSRKFINRLKAAGVDVRCFMPVVFPWLTSKVNYRNHRKVIIVDGKIGFTGGINIAQRYITGNKYGGWRDTHIMVEGDAVISLQALFLTDWYFVSGKQVGNIKDYIVENSVEDQTLIQIATSGPDSDWASIMQAFFAAISRATHHIYISTPYFLPNEAILTAIKIAALSGIDVRLMLPRRADSKIVFWATRSYIGELLDANVKVFLYTPGFNHSKTIMIDSSFCSVGTANMDIRSFEDNFELSAMIYDQKITTELESAFEDDLAQCIRIDPEKWSKRSFARTTTESVARLFSPLL